MKTCKSSLYTHKICYKYELNIRLSKQKCNENMLDEQSKLCAHKYIRTWKQAFVNGRDCNILHAYKLRTAAFSVSGALSKQMRLRAGNGIKLRYVPHTHAQSE